MTDRLTASYAHCELVAKTQARNFYFSFLTLTPERRAAMCAIYAFMRYSDDVSDEAASDKSKVREMAAWRAALDRAFRGDYGDILILPNAWDGASAAVMADAGAKAVATSSAAVAWSHGYPDGDALPLPLLLATVSAVARAAGDTPVTADIEGGYTDDLGELGETIRAVIGAGAVGINLEDGRRDPDLHAAKIEAARKAADATGVNLFINARTDVYLKGLAEGHAARPFR